MEKIKIKIFAFLVIIFLPVSAFARDATSADCFDISGAGTSSANGHYIYFEDKNGKPAFQNETSPYYVLYYYGFYDPYYRWAIGADYESSWAYDQRNDAESGDPSSASLGYTVDIAGSSPVPSVVYACDETGGGTSSSTATSTPYTYYDWLFVNMWIIFLLALIAFGPLVSIFKPKNKQNV